MFCSVKYIGYLLLKDPLLYAVFSMYHNTFNDYGLSNFFYCNPSYKQGLDFKRGTDNIRLISNYILSGGDKLIVEWICRESEISPEQLVDAMMIHYGLWGDHGNGWSDV